MSESGQQRRAGGQQQQQQPPPQQQQQQQQQQQSPAQALASVVTISRTSRHGLLWFSGPLLSLLLLLLRPLYHPPHQISRFT